MDTHSTIIAHKIRKVREIKGLTQEYLAAKLGMSQNAFSKLERGEVHIGDEKLEVIAKVLEVDPDVIKNYSDSTIFNNCTNSGNYNQYHFTESIDKIESNYRKIIEEKDAQIKHLEDRLKSVSKTQ